MKKYDEIWAVEVSDIEKYFHDHPADVRVMSLPDKKIGTMTLPQTRIMIEGDHAEMVYRQFFLHFMKGGG